jgi:hypothetical protein
MTTCLILAAGEAERHNGGNKPLLEVNGETLLNRMWRMCEGYKRWLVTHRSDLVPPEYSDWAANKFNPNSRRWIVETLLSSESLWKSSDCTVVLLGDVYYTHHAIATLFMDRDLNAFGNGFNIHAMRWNSRHNGFIAAGLSKSVMEAESNPRTHGAGKLWTFVECWQIPLIDFGDETTDFDSPQEHKRFIAKYGNRNLGTTEASKAR